MIYTHFTDLLQEKDVWKWPNFSFKYDPKLSCPCCGEFYLDVVSMNCLQKFREILGKPVHINSGHRCPIHNARVGGAPLSQHKKIAFDINLNNHNRHDVFLAARKAGFGSFGFYRTFMHTDIRPGRRWYGKGAKDLWK